MIAPRLIIPSLSISALVLVSGLVWAALPGWFGVIRTVMMALGGLVVIAIVLIVTVAIVSGVTGMIGKLKRKG